MNKAIITISAVVAAIASLAFILRPTPYRDVVKMAEIWNPDLDSRQFKKISSDKSDEEIIQFIRKKKADCESYAKEELSKYQPRRGLQLEGLRRCEAMKKIFARY